MHTLRRGEDGYPSLLLELKDPPEVIHVEGSVSLLLRRPAVAVVGSRQASERGRSLAHQIGRDLGRAGVVVVSGGAVGIDAAAHLGAVDAQGASIVVLPSAVEDPLPRSNRRLFRDVLAAGGVLISEYATTPKGRFPFCARNRIIAALGEIVVVVEARTGSGTQHTVAAARALGRRLCACPWSLGDDRGAGCLDMLRVDARAVGSAEDILAALEGPHDAPAKVGGRSRSRSGVDRRLSGSINSSRPSHSVPGCAPCGGPRSKEEPILRVMADRSRWSAGMLASATGLEVGEVLALLTELEILGRVRADGAGEYRRT